MAQTWVPLGPAAVVDVGSQTAAARFASADVTNDGLPDLVLGLTDNLNFEGDAVPDPIFVLASTPAGGLVNATASVFGGRAVTSAASFNGLSLADFDGDGRPDLLVADSGADRYVDNVPVGPWLGEYPKLALSRGSAPWTDASGSLSSIPPSFLHSLAVGDVDGDGRVDAFLGPISPPPDGVPYLLMNIGVAGAPFVLDRSRLPQRILGEWSDLVELGGGEVRFSNNTFTGSTLADFNRDGRPDLAVMASDGTTRGLVYLNDGTGRFDRSAPIPLPDPLYGTGKTFATRAGGGYTNYRAVGTVELGTGAADLDEDGWVDLVTVETAGDTNGAYYRGGRVHVMLNSGGTGFRTASTTLGFDAAQNYDAYLVFEIADVTGDDRLDILAYRYGPNYSETHVFANRGGGRFERVELPGLPGSQLWVPLARVPGQPLRVAALALRQTDATKSHKPRSVLKAQLYELRGDGPAPVRSWVLPSSARVAGVGTYWTTDLTLRNAGEAPATALVRFLGHGGDGRNGPERSVSLAARESKTIPDVLQTLFGLETDWGPILVTSTADLVVLGQTSTPGAGGTYGQSVPAVPLSDLAGEAPRFLSGLTEGSSFRTNVMLASASEFPVDVDLTLLAPDGSTRSTRRVRLGPLGFAQLNVGTDLGASGVADATLLLTTPTPGASFAAYASAIDRATGDPRTLLPVAAVPSAAWILPSSARAEGVGTFWTTSLTLHNPGNAAATATVQFLGHDGDGRDGPARPVTLSGHETRTFPDVLGSLFGLSGEFGPILVRSSSPLVVQGQTSTPGGGGTFGQSVPGVPFADLAGSAPLTIAGVSENASFRTNLMLAGGYIPTDVDVALVAPDGSTLATRRVRLGPLGFGQLNVAQNFGATNLSGAAFVLSTQTLGGGFTAYASAIDRKTGDPRTLLPR